MVVDCEESLTTVRVNDGRKVVLDRLPYDEDDNGS